LTGHTDEVLDVNFNAMGSKIVTASADNTARIYSSMTGACIGVLDSHTAEISKAIFNS